MEARETFVIEGATSHSSSATSSESKTSVETGTAQSQLDSAYDFLMVVQTRII